MSEQPKRPIARASEAQGLHDGTLTEIRRAMKPQPIDCETMDCREYHPTKVDRHGEEYPGEKIFGACNSSFDLFIACPYPPGSLVWVAEKAGYFLNEDGEVIEGSTTCYGSCPCENFKQRGDLDNVEF